jgi:hypothetical protein
MSEKIIYYSVTLADSSGDNPVGLARRRQLEDGGIKDEMLRHDLNWRADSLIVEWRRAVMRSKNFTRSARERLRR